ncbi:MAG: hypothetical protein OES14_03720 [Nitrosopumilus sp.]|nr:hypothetical protein [Nitrosopumilus sp.]
MRKRGLNRLPNYGKRRDINLENSKAKRKLDQIKKEKTRTVTYRLPEKIIQILESESHNKKISQNVLVNQIFEKYVQWDRFSDKIGMIPVPKDILHQFGDEMDKNDINMIVDVLKPVIKNDVMFIKGKYDLKRFLETLEYYVRATGMSSDHRIEGPLHHFLIQHDLGMTWSLFVEQLLKEIFHEFLPEENIKTQTTSATVITTIALGSDFDEHSK